jgi:hypothetical protein
MNNHLQNYIQKGNAQNLSSFKPAQSRIPIPSLSPDQKMTQIPVLSKPELSSSSLIIENFSKFPIVQQMVQNPSFSAMRDSSYMKLSIEIMFREIFK